MCAFSVDDLTRRLSILLGCRVLGRKEDDAGHFDFMILNVPVGQTYYHCCKVNDFERKLFGNCKGRFSAMAYTPEETIAEFPEEMEDCVSFVFSESFDRDEFCFEETSDGEYDDEAIEEFVLAA